MERKENGGIDVRILDFDGITKIEFYKNGKLFSVINKLDELVKTGVWGGEGCNKDGEVIVHSSDFPIDEPFVNYHLIVLYGHNIYKREISKNDHLALKIHDKKGNVKSINLEK